MNFVMEYLLTLHETASKIGASKIIQNDQFITVGFCEKSLPSSLWFWGKSFGKGVEIWDENDGL